MDNTDDQKMTRIAFRAPEYARDGALNLADFEYRGDQDHGWEILRNGKLHLTVGRGYVAVQTRFCGICSTDLARRFMAFRLPQIIGHEVVAIRDGRPVVVEINASHHGRGLETGSCRFCGNGLETQCPDRLTLGIDRLPGGFAPWLLAPAAGMIDIPRGIEPATASLTEPLAAVLHALTITPPQRGDRVAVLGPRRLGMLLIAALQAHRVATNQDFEIVALARRPRLLALAGVLGADRMIDVRDHPKQTMQFDIVFDTTGSPTGFEQALAWTRRVLHLKSTHGKPVMGLKHLSEMVVDELALLPLAAESFGFHWPDASPNVRPHVFIAESAPKEAAESAMRFGARTHRLPIETAWSHASQNDADFFAGSTTPRFDFAVISSPHEIDRVLRPVASAGHALVSPRGALLLTKNTDHPIFKAVTERGVQIHTSRCGPFRPALSLMQQFPRWTEDLARMITHRYSLEAIGAAFEKAGDSQASIKVLIETAQ